MYIYVVCYVHKELTQGPFKAHPPEKSLFTGGARDEPKDIFSTDLRVSETGHKQLGCQQSPGLEGREGGREGWKDKERKRRGRERQKERERETERKPAMGEKQERAVSTNCCGPQFSGLDPCPMEELAPLSVTEHGVLRVVGCLWGGQECVTYMYM